MILFWYTSIHYASTHLTTKASSLELAEALAVPAGVAGLLSLGVVVCGGLVEYYDCWRNMPQDVKDIHGSLEALRKTFTLLSDKLKHPPFGANVVLRVTESITSCKGGIEALQSELASYHFRRAQYPFKEKTLQKLKSTVKDLRGDLQLALSALRLDVSTTHYQKLNIMHGKLDHLASTSAAASNEIRKDVAHIRTAHDAQAKCTMDSPTSDIASWLSPFNFEAKQNDVFYRRQADTGRWFLESAQFRAWVAGSERPLWCSGMHQFPHPTLHSPPPLEKSSSILFSLADRDAH